MAARFKLDENIPANAASLLRGAGHDVATVLEEGLGGQPDGRVFEAALSERRTLVTLDLDFADARQYAHAPHAGVWALRPAAQSIAQILC